MFGFVGLCSFLCLTICYATDLFSRRFREGIPFPDFVERSILNLPLSKLSVNRALFEGRGKGRKGAERRGGRGEAGKKEKRTRETGQTIKQMWETDFYTPPVMEGAALFDNSAPAVYKIQGS